MDSRTEPEEVGAAGERRCECADSGCSVHPGVSRCENLGTVRLYRIDMGDDGGMLMCSDCAFDAMESGVFTAEDEDITDKEAGVTGERCSDFVAAPTYEWMSRRMVPLNINAWPVD